MKQKVTNGKTDELYAFLYENEYRRACMYRYMHGYKCLCILKMNAK